MLTPTFLLSDYLVHSFQKSQNAVNAAWHRRSHADFNVTNDTQLRIQYSRSSLTSSSQGCTSSTTVAQASARAPTIHLLSPSSALAWASHQRTHNTRRSDSDRRRPPRGEDSSDDGDYYDEYHQPSGYDPDHYGDDERSGSITTLAGEDRALEASKARDPLQAHRRLGCHTPRTWSPRLRPIGSRDEDRCLQATKAMKVDIITPDFLRGRLTIGDLRAPL